MADAPKILETDSLRVAFPKLNSAIDNSNEALTKATGADTKSNTALNAANQANAKSDTTQLQLDTIIIESGTSDAETLQARGEYPLLYNRLDANDERLAQIATNVKSFGAKGDGVTNDTQAILSAYNQSKNIYFPEGNYLVEVDSNGRFIFLEDNTAISFHKRATLLLKPNNRTHYNIVYGLNKKNIRLENVRIIGDALSHLGTTGEAGNGIQLLGCTDVEVISPHITECWGDGILVGSGEYEVGGKYFCENVKIMNPILKRNRRNNLSIISAKNLLIDSPVLDEANGTLPMAGIDIEPNFPTDYLKGIVLRNVQTKSNLGAGIEINLMNYQNSQHVVDILIDGHTDEGSKSCMNVVGYEVSKGLINTKGIVQIKKPVWRLPTDDYNALFRGTSATGIRYEVHNPIIIPKSGGNGILIGELGFPPGTPSTSNVIGNVHIYNPQFEIEGGSVPNNDIVIDKRIHASFMNVSIVDPIKLASKVFMTPGKIENLVIVDKFNTMKLDSSSNTSLGISNTKRLYTNKGATSTVVFTLQDINQGQELTFVNETGTRLAVAAVNANIIHPLGASVIYCDQRGGKITIRKNLTDNGYTVQERVGDWAI